MVRQIVLLIAWQCPPDRPVLRSRISLYTGQLGANTGFLYYEGGSHLTGVHHRGELCCNPNTIGAAAESKLITSFLLTAYPDFHLLPCTL